MADPFFEHPILNSPYDYPNRHWELDDEGQPTQKIIPSRRLADFITPIPKAKKRKGVDLNLEHTGDMRQSTLLMNLTQRLLYTKYRDPGDEPKVHLFGQLKRITRTWLEEYLECKGGTYSAQLMYQELADMACDRIAAAIARAGMQSEDERTIKALFDPYNPTGSTAHVNFHTSRDTLYQTAPNKSHINWVVFDSDWEVEFCRVAENYPKVLAHVKNHNLGFEVPYRYGSENRKYIPDFIVFVDDGHGTENPLHLIVEIKGYRQEDAKIKKTTMDGYWVPGVNNLGTCGRPSPSLRTSTKCRTILKKRLPDASTQWFFQCLNHNPAENGRRNET